MPAIRRGQRDKGEPWQRKPNAGQNEPAHFSRAFKWIGRALKQANLTNVENGWIRHANRRAGGPPAGADRVLRAARGTRHGSFPRCH